MFFKTFRLITLILTGAIVSANLNAEQEHPFLICNRAQFSELRQRAELQPWTDMKSDCYEKIERGFDASKPVELNRYVGACALAYILETENPAKYAQLVKDAILQLDKTGFDPSRLWAGTVAQMGASFVCTLALDIVYDDLSAEEISRCEKMIETCIAIIDREGNWPTARYGTHGTWDIYKGKRTTPDDAYYEYNMIQMTPDGVSPVSPGYAFARMGAGDDRPQKSAYADVLEFTGIDKRYYNNERFQKFYRWLFSGAITPSKDYHLFGDVSPKWRRGNSALFWRVGRFDKKAAAHAAWMLKDYKAPGHILSYILTNEPLPEPVVPQSQFSRSAAVFREVEDSPLSLGAMLYCITTHAEWHTHEEANAISLAAYGNRLLVNGGWLGDEMRPASSNNTIAINGERHEKKTGAGVEDALLGEGFDYACADSGDALGDGKSFKRSLMLVHGEKDLGGYFVTIDEVNAAASDNIHHYLQLATETPVTKVAANSEYLAKIDHHDNVEGNAMAIYYATKPQSVSHNMLISGSPMRDAASGKHWRQEAVFSAENDGKAKILTVLFPTDAKHKKAAFSTISGKGFTGAIIAHNNMIKDAVIVSTNSSPVEYDDISFDAKAVFVRGNQASCEFYFAKGAKKLLIADKLGFESSAPVSMQAKGSCAVITSENNSKVTFYYPDAKAIEINSANAEQLDSGDGWIKVKIPAGQHKLNLR